MTKRLLIDATHNEETRVIIADDQRIHEFDISATTKTQNKGNVYLAKVTRVEPSLQAAFVEYGGGRQGFLPFSEIHPDYYQIPVADRKRLLEEVAKEFEKAQADEELRDAPRPEREDNAERGERGERGERDRNGRRGRGRRRGRTRGRERGDNAGNEEPQLDEEGNPIPVVNDGSNDGLNDGSFDGEDAPFIDENDSSPIATSDEPLPVDAVISDAVDTDVLKGSEEAEAVAAEAKEEDEIAAGNGTIGSEGRSIPAAVAEPEIAKSDIIEEAELLPEVIAEAPSETPVAHDIRTGDEGDEPKESASEGRRERGERGERGERERGEKGEKPHQDDVVETTGQGDGLADEDDFTRRRKASFLRHYKIQEVIKKNQVILVQVIKEERGNKGASLSTYISLAGRYCVLMPNSPKTGGISRKISSSEDRKRLKEISEDIRTENGMSAIIRTAGIDRTRAEIKRDFDYLLKLWDNIRELTLSSTAPAIVHEEADIIKRSLRDLYSSDIKDIVVAGEEAHKRAKEFMKIMMPSHAARIKLHTEDTPIFYAYDVEDQLLRMHEPQVRLESGGSIVINPTEALVSIDVNSGRSTTERNVEETALKTNLEAAAEVARQVRLRDLAGLIVIDFIDMFDYKNRRAVERQLKESLKNDRAKIQVGRISAFGLLEMSRQRMRPSIGETNTIPCPHCDSRGFVLSPEATGMQLIRFLEKEAANGGYSQLTLKVPAACAIHLLNNKRTRLLELEKAHGIKINIDIADHILNAAGFVLERITADGQRSEVSALDGVPANGGGNSKRKRDRKRPKRDRDDFDGKAHSHGDDADDGTESDDVESTEGSDSEKTEQQPRAPRPPREEGDENGERGRRRRGGRRRNRGRDRDRPEGERTEGERPESEREANGNRIPDPELNDVNGNFIPKEAPLPSDDQPSEAKEKESRAKPRTRGGRGRRTGSKTEGGEPSASSSQDNAPDGEGSEGEGDGKGRRGWWRRIVE